MNRSRATRQHKAILTLFIGICVAAFARPVSADTLRITFTTTSPGAGGYEPRNVHVVWVEDNTSAFVITIGRWAATQRDELQQWRNSHTDWNTDTDGVSGATQSNYGTYTLLWDMKDRNGQQVPNGVYTIRHELTNSNAGSNRFNRTTYTVNKNGVSSTQFYASSNGFINVTVEYTAIPVTPPQVDNLPPSLLQGATARLNGDLTDDGGENCTVRVYWGNNDGGTNPGSWDNMANVGSLGIGAFFTDVAGLNLGTTYYYRCYAENSAGNAWAPATESFVAADMYQIIFQEGDGWKYFKGTSFPGAGWNDLGFDDTAPGWLQGPTGIGYGDGDDATVLNDMQNNYDVVYMRKGFNVIDRTNVIRMTFTVDFDDAFIAFINGSEATRRQIDAGGNVTGHEAGTPVVIDLTPQIPLLADGPNVFAIEGHNVTLGSSDFSMIPELTIELGSPQILEPDINLNPTQLNFGSLAAGAQSDMTFGIENTGAAPLTVNSVAIVGLDKLAYGMIAPPAVPFDVAVGATQMITVRFSPTSVQTYGRAKVVVGSIDPDEKVASLSLSGQATGAAAEEAPIAGSVGGDSRAVAVNGSIAFVGQGAALTILNVGDPAAPQRVGQVRLTDVVRGVAVVGDMAYVAAGPTGLIPVDAADVSAPVARIALDTDGHAHDVAAEGTTLCVADGLGGLRVYSLSVAGVPTLQSVVPTSGPARAVSMAGTTAYVLDEEQGILIFNVSNAASPALLGSLNEIELGQAMDVVAGTAYVADRFGRFFVADVSNPAAPSVSGQMWLSEAGRAVAVSGSTARVAVGYSGLELVDVSNPAAPTQTAVFDTPGDAGDVALASASTVVADGSAGVRVIDDSNPAAPTEDGAWTLRSAPTDVAAGGALGFTAEGVAGFQVVNLAPPSAPGQAGFLDTLGEAHRVVVTGSTAYIANGPAGFQIVDISNPAAPTLRGSVPTISFAQSVAVAGLLALVSDGASVYAIDISNLDSPSLQGTWTAVGYAGGVAISGAYGYLAEGGVGLRVLNISNPSNISSAAVYDTPGVAYGVAVANDVAYVADGFGGLQIFNVSSPASPTPIARYDTPGLVVDVTVDGFTAYVVDALTGLEVVDVSAPNAPAIKARSTVPVRGWSAAKTGTVILVADDRGGMVVFGEPSLAVRRWMQY